MIIHSPCKCSTHVYLSFISMRACNLFECEWICAGVFFYIVCLYMYCRWRSNYDEMMVVISLTGLIRHLFVPAPSHEPDFQLHIYFGSTVCNYTSCLLFWLRKHVWINQYGDTRYSVPSVCGTGNHSYLTCISMNAK
jgi:hypothetical protein